MIVMAYFFNLKELWRLKAKLYVSYRFAGKIEKRKFA